MIGFVLTAHLFRQYQHILQRMLIMLAFQEPAPMTEDLLEEQSEVLAKLGTSAEGTHLRARMQSACLLSDMESFKVRAGKLV